MAAGLRQMKLHNKRKSNELEDISNIHKKSRTVSFKNQSETKKPITRSNLNRKRTHFVTPPSPPQQRSSPPATCLEDVTPQHQQDNDHDTEQDQQQHHHHVSFPATPPESINDGGSTPIAAATNSNRNDSYNENNNTSSNNDNEYKDAKNKDVQTLSASNGISANNSTGGTYAEVTTSSSTDGETIKQDLNENPDYIALTSSLRMAKITNAKINQDIIELSKLQQYYSTNANKEETIQFFLKLINNELNLPKPTKITKCPIINWSKYHPCLSQVNKDFENQLRKCDKKEQAKNSLYKALNLFDKLK
ncbi:conserved hypothetical protein [Candida dubliniensis CD36]|uniref:Uncharacterized protein n=1 Tax=Candida dubliniensis (strain CD36 / ATCC MYA-646 / CBS 7987 / NCPF 3949 / NRRL Y-17841) TaxID=573826 RepID=B9W7U0_CANDC|nr:conserved hypothetical protein [Candida dubliniensis CD36]CAX44753.1 conserved hypothetical protein [Candida dubliniensis CD36]